MRPILLAMKLLLLAHSIFGQVSELKLSSSINSLGQAPHSSAVFDVQSNSKGLLLPRMTTDQRLKIIEPANGLLVFDLCTNSFWFYFSDAWQNLSTSSNNSNCNELVDKTNELNKKFLESRYNQNTKFNNFENPVSICADRIYYPCDVKSHPSSMLHLQSSDKGFLLPRMKSTERSTISNPANGLLVYDVDSSKIFYYNKTSWKSLTSSRNSQLHNNQTNIESKQTLIYSKGQSNNHYNETSNNFELPISINENGAPPDDSAIIDIQSTSKGILIPSMYTSQRFSIANPANGLMVFDYETESFWFYSNLYWHEILTEETPQGIRTENQIISIISNSDRDYFGNAVSTYGNYMVVGAPLEDTSEQIYSYRLLGTAYIYQKLGNNWFQIEKLLPNDTQDLEFFGTSVVMSENYILVMSYNYATSKIFIHTFKKTDEVWVEEDKINLGYSTSIILSLELKLFGNYAFIGIPDANNNGGVVSVLQLTDNGWILDSTLTASDGASNDYFGSSLALNNNYALVGAIKDQHNNIDGSVYVFKLEGNTWLENTKLKANDTVTGSSFGISIGLEGDYAIIGAQTDEFGRASGSAYIFNKSNDIWTQQTKLLPSVGHEFGYFGAYVDISTNYAVVGVAGNEINEGVVYVFEKVANNWPQKYKLLGSDFDVFFPEAESRYGSLSLSIDGNNVFVGLPEWAEYDNNAYSYPYYFNFGNGKVYYFNLE